MYMNMYMYVYSVQNGAALPAGRQWHWHICNRYPRHDEQPFILQDVLDMLNIRQDVLVDHVAGGARYVDQQSMERNV